MKHFYAATALILGLAACAPASPPTPDPPPVMDVVDGLYRGTTTRFQARLRSCPRPGLVSFQLFDRKFQYRWDRSTYIDAEISPDGRIHGQGPGITLQGRVDGPRIEGDVTNGECGLHFTVRHHD